MAETLTNVGGSIVEADLLIMKIEAELAADQSFSRSGGGDYGTLDVGHDRDQRGRIIRPLGQVTTRRALPEVRNY